MATSWGRKGFPPLRRSVRENPATGRGRRAAPATNHVMKLHRAERTSHAEASVPPATSRVSPATIATGPFQDPHANTLLDAENVSAVHIRRNYLRADRQTQFPRSANASALSGALARCPIIDQGRTLLVRAPPESAMGRPAAVDRSGTVCQALEGRLDRFAISVIPTSGHQRSLEPQLR